MQRAAMEARVKRYRANMTFLCTVSIERMLIEGDVERAAASTRKNSGCVCDSATKRGMLSGMCVRGKEPHQEGIASATPVAVLLLAFSHAATAGEGAGIAAAEDGRKLEDDEDDEDEDEEDEDEEDEELEWRDVAVAAAAALASSACSASSSASLRKCASAASITFSADAA